jgi:hypothetical protein
MARRAARGAELVTIYWRDIPAQVNGQDGRDRHQVLLSQVPARDRPRQAQGGDLHRRPRTSPSGGVPPPCPRASTTSPPPRPGPRDRGRVPPRVPRQARIRRRVHRRRHRRRRIGRAGALEELDPTPQRGEPSTTQNRRHHDRHRDQLGHPRGRDRLRPAVRDDRRAHQPDRPQAPRRGDEGRRLQPGRGRRARPGRGRRPHARRQRRHPARRRAGAPRRGRAAGPGVTDVPLSIDSSIVDALEPGSPSTRASRSSTRSPARTRCSSGCCRWSPGTARRSWRSPTTRPASPRTPTSGSRSRRRSSTGPPTTASPSDVVVDPLVMPIGAMATAGGRCSAGAPPPRGARGQHHRAVRRTSASGSPTATSSTGTFLAMADRERHDLGDHEPAARRGEARR